MGERTEESKKEIRGEGGSPTLEDSDVKESGRGDKEHSDSGVMMSVQVSAVQTKRRVNETTSQSHNALHSPPPSMTHRIRPFFLPAN